MLQGICVEYIIFSIISFSVIVQSYVLNWGDCIIYYEEACSVSDIKFYLYTSSETRVNINILDPFSPELLSDFNLSIPIKIIVHGYGGLRLDFATRNITYAYINLGYNVILVDWGHLAEVPCYPAAFFNTWHVGQCIAVLSVSLAKFGIMPNNIHILGFSLGAHIASFASNHMSKTIGMPYHRITGLDPALPFFATLNNEWKLDKSDAPFVDVIHTSAGSFGKLEAMGHVDFYINGGTLQPACINASYPTLCSHMLVGLYYANTIRNELYFGFECPSILHYTLGFCEMDSSMTLMGEYTNYKSRGIYFVNIQLKNASDIDSLNLYH